MVFGNDSIDIGDNLWISNLYMIVHVTTTAQTFPNFEIFFIDVNKKNSQKISNPHAQVYDAGSKVLRRNLQIARNSRANTQKSQLTFKVKILNVDEKKKNWFFTILLSYIYIYHTCYTCRRQHRKIRQPPCTRRWNKDRLKFDSRNRGHCNSIRSMVVRRLITIRSICKIQFKRVTKRSVCLFHV